MTKIKSKNRPNTVALIIGIEKYSNATKASYANKDAEHFYEYAKIFDNYYGTSKKSVNSLHEENYDVVFDIDWQGTKQLSKYKELNLIKIFILPPSKKELKNRLINRNQDNKKTVEKRLNQFMIPTM